MKNQDMVAMSLGDKLRVLRDEKNLMQREAGAVIEVDGAFISKVENNEKPMNRNHLQSLSKFFDIKEEELQTLWLADKIYNLTQDEPTALAALNQVIIRINKADKIK